MIFILLYRSGVEEGVWRGERVGAEWYVSYHCDGAVCRQFS
jgi:hypothetical protein